MKRSKALHILVVVVLVSAMLMSMTACGSGGKKDIIKIGIINFLYGTRGMNAAQEYLEYLSENFPVEFEYVTCASTDAESNIASTENLITSGADVILSYVCDGAVQCTKLCEDAGVYFGMVMVKEYEEDIPELTASDYYLGAIHPETDAYTFAQELAEELMGEGYENFVTVGFNIGLVRENDKLTQGFQDYVNDNGGNMVTTINESIASLAEATTTMVANYGDQVDYIFAPAAGANFVLPRITDTDIRICVNDVPNNAKDLLGGKNLDYIYELPYECIGIMTVLGINAVNGVKLEGQPDLVSIESKASLLRSAEDVDEYLELTKLGEDGVPLYTAEELDQFILDEGETASWSDLMKLCASNHLEDIALRHAG